VNSKPIWDKVLNAKFQIANLRQWYVYLSKTGCFIKVMLMVFGPRRAPKVSLVAIKRNGKLCRSDYWKLVDGELVEIAEENTGKEA